MAAGKERILRFGTGNITKMIVEFSVPAMAGLVIAGLCNVIDSIFLGNYVGEVGLTVTAVALPVTIVMIALSALVGMGGNTLTAIRFGEGDYEEAEHLLGVSLAILLLFGAIVAVVGYAFTDPILRVCGVTPESMDMARTFVRVLCLGFVFNAVMNGINNFIRTAGSPGRALTTMIIGAVACTILNYLFVVRMGMGVFGSALATILGQAISAASVIQFFLSKKTPFRLHARYIRLDPARMKAIFTMGMPLFLLQIAVAGINIMLNNLFSYYGALSAVGAVGGLAITGVINRVNTIMMFLPLGVAQGVQVLEGYNLGARNYGRVKEIYKKAFLFSVSVAGVAMILVQIFAGSVVSMFGLRGETLALGVQMMRIWFFVFICSGGQLITANYFMATGQPRLSTFLLLTRQLIYMVPLYWFVPKILHSLIGFDYMLGITVAQPIGDTLSLITALVFMRFEWKRLNKLEAQQALAE